MAGCEFATPHCVFKIGRIRFWSHNLGIVILNTIVLRLLFPTTTIGMVAAAPAGGFGFLNVVELPLQVTVLLAVDVRTDCMLIQPALSGGSAYSINQHHRSVD